MIGMTINPSKYSGPTVASHLTHTNSRDNVGTLIASPALPCIVITHDTSTIVSTDARGIDLEDGWITSMPSLRNYVEIALYHPTLCNVDALHAHWDEYCTRFDQHVNYVDVKRATRFLCDVRTLWAYENECLTTTTMYQYDKIACPPAWKYGTYTDVFYLWHVPCPEKIIDHKRRRVTPTENEGE